MNYEKVDRPTITITLQLSNGGIVSMRYRWDETDEGIRDAVLVMDEMSGGAATYALSNKLIGTEGFIKIDENNDVTSEFSKISIDK